MQIFYVCAASSNIEIAATVRNDGADAIELGLAARSDGVGQTEPNAAQQANAPIPVEFHGQVNETES
jgi:hypothetical protein